MLHWNQVLKRVHELAGVHVEKRAVMEFISYFEERMDMVISQSAKELEKRNALNSVQGLKPRQRINHECIREAIKAISNESYPSAPGRAGGTKEEGEKDEKHPQNHQKNQGAEIT